MKSQQTILCLAILLNSVAINAQVHRNHEKTKNMEATMTDTQTNMETVRKLYEESLNKRNLQLLEDLISEDYVGISGTKGVAGFKEPVAAVMKAIPDAQWKIEELVSDGNKVVVRWKLQGTHSGQFQQFAATGKSILNDGIGIFEFENDKIIRGQVYTDRLGFLQQLNVLPSDLRSLSNEEVNKDHVRFIDKFVVPEKAKQEFLERLKINRNFIKNLPGFVEDAAYESTDEQGNLIFITIAVWESEDAVRKAKETVQAEYKREGFNLAAMLERLEITMDRGTYKNVADQ
jgi:steroid delta-isomerase-like uncharacterized protein